MQRRHLLALVMSLAAVAALGCTKKSEGTTSTPETELKSLTVDQVATRLAANDGKTFVYDNNPKELYANRHVPGAKWLDEDHVTAADLPADKSATLIFYCHNES